MKMTKKYSAAAIILLFIGIAFVPSINFNIVKAASDDVFIEVTSEACGIKGYGNQTVKLTKEHYQNLEQYLVEFRARLNHTSTREEAVPIFKEAVVELNKYGLLPRGTSVERAQRLVTTGYHIENIPYILKKSNRGIVNICCLFAAETIDAFHLNIWTALGLIISLSYQQPSRLVQLLIDILLFFGSMKPLHFDSEIHLYNGVKYFAIGLGGIDKGENNIGGVIGYIGLKINLDLHRSFLLGFAYLVVLNV
jgi:hypothetical protein